VIRRLTRIFVVEEQPPCGTANIETAAANLRALKTKVSEQLARQLCTLNVVTAGAESYTRPDGVNVIALGHLFAQHRSGRSEGRGVRRTSNSPKLRPSSHGTPNWVSKPHAEHWASE
jgi:hypothetical protein